MESGELRHRITIERRINQRDSTTGEILPAWVPLFSDVPAKIRWLRASEYLAAAAMQSELRCEITIRQRQGLTPIDATQRFIHGTRCCIFHGRQIFNPEGALPDNESGAEYLRIMCSEGTDQGG